MNESHVLDLIPAYALDCLDRDEAVRVAEHLAGCASCRAELAAYRAVVDNLALAAAEVEPPPELKERIARRIRPAPAGEPWWAGLAGLFRRSVPAWGLVSLALVLVLGASTLLLLRQAALRQRDTTLANMRLVALAGTESAPGASGVLVMSHDGREGTLVVDDLPPLDAGHQYQLWLIDAADRRTSAGVFSVNDRGYGALWILAPERLSGYPAFGVTVEPAGGSPGPTGPKVLGGTT